MNNVIRVPVVVQAQGRSWAADDELLGGSPERKVRFTLFSDRAGKTKKEHTASLKKMASVVSERTAATKGQLPWLKLALFGAARTERVACDTRRT